MARYGLKKRKAYTRVKKRYAAETYYANRRDGELRAIEDAMVSISQICGIPVLRIRKLVYEWYSLSEIRAGCWREVGERRIFVPAELYDPKRMLAEESVLTRDPHAHVTAEEVRRWEWRGASLVPPKPCLENAMDDRKLDSN